MTEENRTPPPPPAPPAPAGEEERSPAPPPVLPVLPVSDLVLFPGMVVPLAVGSDRSKKLIDDEVAASRHLLVVLQRDRTLDDDRVGPKDLFGCGCLARLVKMMKFPDQTVRVLVQGVDRCRLEAFPTEEPYLKARYTTLPDHKEKSVELDALAAAAAQRFRELVSLSPTLPDELQLVALNLPDPGKLSDLITVHLNMELEERQALLEETDPRARLAELTRRLNREHEVLQLGTEIRSKANETMSKSQREYFLREQLKAIRDELGEESQQQTDRRRIEEKIEAARMPAEAREAALKETERLAVLSPMSPEYGIVRTYLDWLTELPWSATTKDRMDLAAARRVLDRDHCGLRKPKERILEYLAVLQLKREMKGPILCFSGPPGVGKTSLGQSIARALGRAFVRLSLGGVHDEAEIRGHRRTYIGALPGRIIQGLRKAGTRNPVFMLDEIDKIGSDFRGDPASALLEVLDPEQNVAFADHYLDVTFDLSSVLFITTANRLDTIPPPLRDRMEVLELPGYTTAEKVRIARRHLVRKQVKAHGLKSAEAVFPADTLELLVGDYTREAGVRNLEREIAAVCRKLAREKVARGARRVTVTKARVRSFLGPPRFEAEEAERRMEPGVATGLAWTPVGGEILFVEATRMPGRGQLLLTGSMGDVMKESAHAALSYVRANAARFKLDLPAMDKTDLHIHVPSGAIPKDGPSAGVAMILALVSLFRNRSLPSDMAFSGEITLRGRVMPVGGIKEKVLAAHRAGIRRVLLPQANRATLAEIPADVRRQMTFLFVRDVARAIRLCNAEEPSGAGKRRTAAPKRKA